ncbi:MAG: DUF4340 domain-containing protein [FCB group bacterium]|jgi:hypothetical protein|nr:DUF4340 domain-containing protein [FCB group bacterium]
MSGRSVGILTILLVALGLLFWFTKDAKEQSRIAEEADKKVFAFAPGDVQSITITRGDNTPVTARQQNGEWSVVEPYPLKAESLRLKRMAETIATLASDRTLDISPSDFPEYGLDKPALTLEFEAGGKTNRIDFGGMAPTQDHRYARLDEGPVLLLRSEAFSELNARLQDLRDRSIVEAGPAGVTRFEFAWTSRDDKGNPKESVPVVVEKRDDGRWYMVKPVEGAAQQEMVQNLASMLAQMPGRDYVDAPESLADYGLAPQKARITAWTGPDSAPQTVYIGGLAKTGEKDGLYAKREDAPAVFVVEPGFVQHFPQSPDSYLARTLLTYPASDMRKLHYTAGTTEIVLENDPKKGWTMTQPAVEMTDQENASEFIAALKDLPVLEFLPSPPDPAMLEPNTWSMDITLKDGKTFPIVVGKSTAEGDYYAIQDTGMPARVPAKQVEDLKVEPFFFQDKLIFDFPQDKITRFVLELDGLRYIFERVGRDWLVREPANKRWESQGDMLSLLRALSPVYALGLEPAGMDPARTGLDKPVLTIEASAAATARLERDMVYGPLSVGVPSEGDSQQRYASVVGRSEVYRVPQFIVDAVREALKGVREAQ